VAAADSAEFALVPDLTPAIGHWSNYPMTVARRIARNFPGALHGADIRLASDLPAAAGMSSSSAMIILTFLALDIVNRLRDRDAFKQNIVAPLDLASYLATIENGQSFRGLAGDRGVGTFGGSEDHTAILFSRAGLLSRYSFSPLLHESDVPFPRDYILAIAVSGVTAEKTGAAREKYNRASAQTARILDIARSVCRIDAPTLAAAIQSSPDARARIESQICACCAGDAQGLLARMKQFALESEQIIPAATDALAACSWAQLGALVDESQWMAEQLLGNQVPQTSFLARSAREVGAVAASAFGAGFGGSVWAMVRADQQEDFARRWSAAYRSEFAQGANAARFLATCPGPAAICVQG
jgi:galactokinase